MCGGKKFLTGRRGVWQVKNCQEKEKDDPTGQRRANIDGTEAP